MESHPYSSTIRQSNKESGHAGPRTFCGGDRSTVHALGAPSSAANSRASSHDLMLEIPQSLESSVWPEMGVMIDNQQIDYFLKEMIVGRISKY